MSEPIEPTDDDSLQNLWTQACQNFRDDTLDELPVAPEYSADEGLELICARQEEDDEKAARYREVKGFVSKMITFIGILGSIFTQDVVRVRVPPVSIFAKTLCVREISPTSLCLNALSYLIEHAARYKKVFAVLSELFQRICNALDHLKIDIRMMKAPVNIALRSILNQLLLCFVRTCGQSIRVLQGCRVLLAPDISTLTGFDEIRDRLAHMDTLAREQRVLRARLQFGLSRASEERLLETLERSNTIDTSVSKLFDAERERDPYFRTKQMMEELDIILDKPSEAWARMQGRLEKINSQRVVGTGEWVLDHHLYKSWAITGEAPYQALTIQGNEGSGKPFLLGSIFQDLKKMHSEKEDIRSSVAYYSIDQPSDGRSLSHALKVLAWQIAKSNIVYCKSLTTISMSNGWDIPLLWESLFDSSYESDMSFFLLLDGLDNLDSSEIFYLSYLLEFVGSMCSIRSTDGKFKLRILLSGRAQFINDIRSQVDYSGAEFKSDVLNVAGQNDGDLEKFIEQRINRVCNLGGSSEEAIAIRGEVLESVQMSVKGDFIAARLLLDGIDKEQRPNEIRTILARSGCSREEIIRGKIQQLNASLSEGDVDDLNEILTWLIFAAAPLTVAQLEDVLSVKNGERSLNPLSESIANQYSSLICIEDKPRTTKLERTMDSRVLLISDSVKGMIMGPETWKPIGESKSGIEVKPITKSEIRIVRDLVESVCDATLFERVGFPDFFQQKLGETPAEICVNKDRAHFGILKICLETMCSSGTCALREYAAKFFPSHLEHVNLSLIHANDKATIGPHLVALFFDAAVIDRWWTTDRVSLARQREVWFYKDTYTELVMGCLRDPAIIKNLRDEQLRWVRGLVLKSDPDSDILERIAQQMAKCWFQTDTSTDVYIKSRHFPPVYGYFAKIEHRKDPTKERPRKDPENGDIEPSQILETANLVSRKFYGRDTLAPQEIHVVGSTLLAYGKLDESIAHLKVALTHSGMYLDHAWKVRWDLAMAYVERKQYSLAEVILRRVVRHAERQIMPPGGNAAKRFTYFVKRDQASCLEKDKNSGQAVEVYQDLLEDFPNEYQLVRKILAIYIWEPESMLRFLESLQHSIDEETGLDRQTLSFLELSGDETFHAILLDAKYDGPLFEAVRTAYRVAIAAADTQCLNAENEKHKDKNADGEDTITYHTCRKVSLMRHHAAYCYRSPTANTADRRHAIKKWEYILKMDLESRCYLADLEWVLIKTRENLAKAYIAEAQRDSERSSSYLSKLEQFATVKVSNDVTNRLKREAAHLLARHHTLQGDKKKAKSILRPYLKVDLDILCHEESLNDWEGYQCLASHFWAISEMDLVIAAWSLITPHPGYSSSDKLQGPLNLGCGGLCGTRWTYGDNLYLCATCKDLRYDRACLDQLRSGTFEVTGCEKDHEMVYIPAYDPVERETVGKGNVRVGGEIMSVQSWIRLIRQDWGLDN